MEELKKLLEDQGRAFDEFKKANDARLASIEAKGSAPAELEGKVAEINADMSRIAAEIKALTVKSQRPEIGAPADERVAEYKNALFGAGGYLRTGKIQDTLRAGSDPDSGYLLAEDTIAAVERVATANNAMEMLADVETIASGTWRQPVVTSGASAGWVGETSSRAATTTPTVSEVKIDAEECYANLPAYQRTLDDSSIDIERWLIDESGFTFADLEGAGFITGTGINSPRGIMSYSFAANASYAWGKVGYIASGASGAFADTNPADYIVDLVHALKPKYRTNGTFVMSDVTLSSIRKFQDGQGNYLWQPGLQLGVPDRILGYPVVTDDNVATVASNSYSIAFGDFKRAYKIVKKSGITLLRDPYTTKGLVYFYMTRRVGGGIKNFEALKVMKMASS